MPLKTFAEEKLGCLADFVPYVKKALPANIFNPIEEMKFFTNRYYNYNRFLFVILGQWPYQNFKTRFILTTIVLIDFGSTFVSQVTKLTEVSNFDSIFEILVTILCNVICMIRYCNCMIYMNEFLKIFEDIKDVWAMTVVKEEIEIMKHYAEEGRMYTLLFIAFSYFSFGFIDLVSLIPCVLDVVAPLNHTRARKFLYKGEFFVDSEKYFYPILLYSWITVFFGVTVLVATESIFLMYGQHCCGMFKILWFITNIVSFHEISFFLQFLISVLLLSIALIQIKTFLGKYEVLIYISLVGALMCHGFLFAYPMQKVLDHSSALVESAYNGSWYYAPIKAQKLLLLIIKRNINVTPIIIMKILASTYESYGMAVKTSLSYFTVLYSFR